MKPDFIFVGGTRAAGMYITKVLMTHPEIFIGQGAGSRVERDNLHFFNDDLTDPYFMQFRGHEGKIIGESKRGDYLYKKMPSGEPVVHKLNAMNPKIKIIISLRNPMHRTFSHYSKLSAEGKLENSNGLMADFEHLMASAPKSGCYGPIGSMRLVENSDPTSGFSSLSRVITDSLYYENVKSYIDLLSKNRVKVIIHYDESWFKDWDNAKPEETFRDLYSFLGVDSNFNSPVLHQRINTLSMSMKGLKSLSVSFYRLLNKLGFYRASRSYFKYISNAPVLDKETYLFLLDVFLDDITRLENLLDVDLSSWKRFGA